MNLREHLIRCLCCSVMAAASGCAAAYHDYPCGNVSYGYCPPPPLPYARYDTCPTPLAAEFSSGKTVKHSRAELATPPIPDIADP